MSKYRGEIGLLIVALVWGSGFVASDISLLAFSPYQVLALRFTISAIILSIGFRKKFKEIDKRSLKLGVILGSILYFSFVLQIVGLVYTTPSKNAFLTSVNVAIVPLIGLILYKNKLDVHGFVGALLALFGIAVISFNMDLSINIGDVLTLCSAFGFAFHIFYTGEFLKRGIDPIVLTLLQIISAAVLSVIFSFFISGLKPIGTDVTKSLISAIYLGIFSTSIAFFLQTVSQKLTTQTKSAIILSTEAVFGSIFSIIILKEQLAFRTVIGSAIIFSAIIISEIKPNFIILTKKFFLQK